MHRQVLVVEDDTDLRESLRDILAGEGYGVLLAADGQGALNVLRENRSRPCLIILDAMMSGMSGAQFLSVLRRDHPADLARIPVLLATGMGDAMLDEHFVGLDKLTKPFDIDDLLTTVAKLCGVSNTV
jgi:CheY-like chemotaxis protein